MRILVVGAGAIGGYFGGRLLAAQKDVTFLVRAHRKGELAKKGLEIKSSRGEAHLSNPPAILAEELRVPFGLIILSCKSQDLPEVMDSLGAAVGEETVILPLLNGMHHLELLDNRFGRDRVIGGTCVISAVRDKNGIIVHLNDMDRLSFGERDGSHSRRVEEIEATFSGAGFEFHRSESILQEMWEKWVFIATTAGINCLMRASIGDIVAADASSLTLKLLSECASVAASEGFAPTSSFMEKNASMLTTPKSPLTASMLRDLESHAPIEADPIVGDLLARGLRHNLATPMLEIVYAHLRTYEARRNREGLANAIPL